MERRIRPTRISLEVQLTPEDVKAWRVWGGGSRGWAWGSPLPGGPSAARSERQVRVARFMGSDGIGHTLPAELWLDSPEAECWELWQVGIDGKGGETGYAEALAWCWWPEPAACDVACFLITVQRRAFLMSLAEAEVLAQRILIEDMPGVGALLLPTGDDKDEED